MYEIPAGPEFPAWLKKMTDQGLWVVPLGDDQYQVVEPREWYCPCGRYVNDSPACAHGEELSAPAERKLQFFNVLMWDVGTVADFERECEADRKGGARGW